MPGSKALIYRAAPIDKLETDVHAFGETLVGAAAIPEQPATFVDPDLFMHLPTRRLGPGPAGKDAQA